MKTLIVLLLSALPATAFAGPELHPDLFKGQEKAPTAPAAISENGVNPLGEPIRLVNQDRHIAKDCDDATWPYIPKHCLTRGKPASGTASGMMK
jgi:hypothetical protein